MKTGISTTWYLKTTQSDCNRAPLHRVISMCLHKMNYAYITSYEYATTDNTAAGQRARSAGTITAVHDTRDSRYTPTAVVRAYSVQVFTSARLLSTYPECRSYLNIHQFTIEEGGSAPRPHVTPTSMLAHYTHLYPSSIQGGIYQSHRRSTRTSDTTLDWNDRMLMLLAESS